MGNARGFCPYAVRLLQETYCVRDRHIAPQLWDAISHFSARIRLPAVPPIYFVPDQIPNSIGVAGLSNSTAVIGTDPGFVAIFSDEEFRAVVAHEIAHIKYRDLLYKFLLESFPYFFRNAGILVGIIILARVIIWWSGLAEVSLGYGDSIAFYGYFVFMICDHIVAYPLAFIFRSAEYRADAVATLLIGTPRPLIRALAKTVKHVYSSKEQKSVASYVAYNDFLLSHPAIRKRFHALAALEVRKKQ